MFDSYNIPMNNLEPWLTYSPISAKDLALYAKNVEKVFDLPQDILKKRWGGKKPVKKYDNVNLSEVRRVAIYKILVERDIPYMAIAPHFGIENHASVVRIRKVANNLIEVNDEKFNQYYSKVKDIAI